MKILLGEFNAKVGRKPTVGNEHLHQDSNDNGVSKLCNIKKSSEEHTVPAPRHS